MTQYDAGPGEHSDRPWEVPDKKAKAQARRQKVALPPWALLAVLVGIVVLLCVGLVLLVQALRGGGEEGTPSPAPEETMPVLPTDVEPTAAPTGVEAPTEAVSPTATIVLPIGTPAATVAPGTIGPGVRVAVTGTAGSGLNLRADPSTGGRIVVNAREGTILTVIEGPQTGGGYTWWKLRTATGQEGWGAANWLQLSSP
jgi:hypothetical protein